MVSVTGYTKAGADAQFAPQSTTVKKGDLVVNAKDYGAKGDGTTDDTAAINNALAAGNEVLLPQGSYLITSTITVPAGKVLRGSRALAYTGNPSQGSRVIVTNAAQTGAILSLAARAAIVDLAVVGAGVNASPAHTAVLLNSLNTVSGCTITGAKIGIDGNYTSANQIQFCQIHQNSTIGVQNTVDSTIIGNYINLNGLAAGSAGIYFGNGANDNIVVGNKIEWNHGYGILASNTVHNIIGHNVIDRSDQAGIKITGSTSATVANNMLRRNGAASQSTAADDVHFWLEGNTSLSLSGNLTEHGANDDGTGYNSPSVTVRGNANTDVVWTGNQLGGNTSGSAFGYYAAQTREKLVNNVGTSGETFIGRANLAIASGSANAAATFTSPALNVSGAAMGTYATGFLYTVEVVGRNGGTGARNAATLPVLVSREAGNATITLGAVANQIGTDYALTGGGQTLSVTVDTTGQNLTVSVVNNSTGTFNYQVRVL